MQRTRAERRAQMERMIKKRLTIIRNAWGYNGSRRWNREEDFPWAFASPHRFNKCNLRTCSRPCCKKGPRPDRGPDPKEE